MAKKTYGRTASGAPITDDLVDKLAARAARPRAQRRARAQGRERSRNSFVSDPQGVARVPQGRLSEAAAFRRASRPTGSISASSTCSNAAAGFATCPGLPVTPVGHERLDRLDQRSAKSSFRPSREPARGRLRQPATRRGRGGRCVFPAHAHRPLPPSRREPALVRRERRSPGESSRGKRSVTWGR